MLLLILCKVWSSTNSSYFPSHPWIIIHWKLVFNSLTQYFQSLILNIEESFSQLLIYNVVSPVRSTPFSLLLSINENSRNRYLARVRVPIVVAKEISYRLSCKFRREKEEEREKRKKNFPLNVAIRLLGMAEEARATLVASSLASQGRGTCTL